MIYATTAVRAAPFCAAFFLSAFVTTGAVAQPADQLRIPFVGNP